MNQAFILHGWHLSYYSGKARSYLSFKGTPFVDRGADAWTLLACVRHETGVVVMPVIVTPEGELQDTSVIIDRLEARFPARPVVPEAPLRRFASYWLELWGDEWWLPMAMHARWSRPENLPFFVADAGKELMPRAPRFLHRRVGAIPMRQRRQHVPAVGVVPAQLPLLDTWIDTMLDVLETHFSVHRFLLGAAPSLADFGLVGPMHARLGRDPWSKRAFIEPRPHLASWIARVTRPALADAATLGVADDDTLPATLDPVSRHAFGAPRLARAHGTTDAHAPQVSAALPWRRRAPASC